MEAGAGRSPAARAEDYERLAAAGQAEGVPQLPLDGLPVDADSEDRGRDREDVTHSALPLVSLLADNRPAKRS